MRENSPLAEPINNSMVWVPSFSFRKSVNTAAIVWHFRGFPQAGKWVTLCNKFSQREASSATESVVDERENTLQFTREEESMSRVVFNRLKMLNSSRFVGNRGMTLETPRCWPHAECWLWKRSVGFGFGLVTLYRTRRWRPIIAHATRRGWSLVSFRVGDMQSSLKVEWECWVLWSFLELVGEINVIEYIFSYEGAKLTENVNFIVRFNECILYFNENNQTNVFYDSK